MGLVTTCSVAVDFDTSTVLFQLISTGGSGVCEDACSITTSAMNDAAKRRVVLKDRRSDLVTCTSELQELILRPWPARAQGWLEVRFAGATCMPQPNSSRSISR